MPLQSALDAIAERGRIEGECIAFDKARVVSVEVDFPADPRRPFAPFRMRVTGVAPFVVARSIGGLTGASGWTVQGQIWSWDNLPHTTIEPLGEDAPLWLSVMTQREAMRLCEAVNEAAGMRSEPISTSTKAA